MKKDKKKIKLNITIAKTKWKDYAFAKFDKLI